MAVEDAEDLAAIQSIMVAVTTEQHGAPPAATTEPTAPAAPHFRVGDHKELRDAVHADLGRPEHLVCDEGSIYRYNERLGTYVHVEYLGT